MEIMLFSCNSLTLLTFETGPKLQRIEESVCVSILAGIIMLCQPLDKNANSSSRCSFDPI
jgi:hypothetical protein